MDEFSRKVVDCMENRGLPLPELTLEGLKDLFEKIKQALEDAGGLETIGALVPALEAMGVEATTIQALAAVSTVAADVYLMAALECMAWRLTADAWKRLFAQNPPQPFMAEKLAELGVPMDEIGSATV